jgi:hypothetical protein
MQRPRLPVNFLQAEGRVTELAAFATVHQVTPRSASAQAIRSVANSGFLWPCGIA